MAKKKGKKKVAGKKNLKRKITKKRPKKIVKLKVRKVKPAQPLKKWSPTPLKGSFMVLAIIGFLITVYIVYPISFNFGVAFMTIFAVMFIAALISMGQAPLPK